ncbi:hypothetical protein D9619_001493 [Psilocybe cf. subviscida]|uniref:Core domain-containing protein n=1 Tax=Psilocybe cf. subviscida TaxID=2480587 RepID=A0A8H5BET2_9AGAR|nr:hypothetical protein D9619_001493 [Psilocybe cf. subviscida]
MSNITKAIQCANRLPRLLRNHPRPAYAELARARPTLPSRIQRLSTTPRQTAALASSLPTHPTEVLFAPSQEAIEKEELDVELLPPEQVKLEITDRAAEQLMKIAEREQNSAAALRIAVESGGCHGYQYKMELAKERAPDDYLFNHPSIKPSNLLIDAVSLSLMNGSTIDFTTELIGSSFKVAHNPQAKGSGCGCGFDGSPAIFSSIGDFGSVEWCKPPQVGSIVISVLDWMRITTRTHFGYCAMSSGAACSAFGGADSRKTYQQCAPSLAVTIERTRRLEMIPSIRVTYHSPRKNAPDIIRQRKISSDSDTGGSS